MMDIMDMIGMRECALEQAAEDIREGAPFNDETLLRNGVVDPLDYELERINALLRRDKW